MKKYLLLLILIAFATIADAQYCTPAYYNFGIASGSMSRFVLNGFGGTSINDTLLSVALSTGYTDRTGSVGIVRMQQGRSYAGTVFYFTAQAYTGNQVWVDFNNDNTFADSERVSVVAPSMYAFGAVAGSASLSVNIPVGAPTGTFRMRVRNVAYYLGLSPGYGSANLNPCTTGDATNQYYNGITADYLVNIVAVTPCSGTPVAGDASGITSTCNGVPFDLALVNDTVAGSISYQWYSKPVGSGSYSPVSGAVSKYYHSAGLSTSTQYVAVLTCGISGLRDTSTVLTVTQNAFYQCYCSLSIGGDTASATIDSVAIAGTSLSVNIPHNSRSYLSFPDTGSATTTLTRGLTYGLFLKSGGYRNYSAHLWIDYNNNGVYDSIEYVNIDSSVMASGTAYCTFTVPMTADTGLAGLRIRTFADTGTFGGARSCTYVTNGATEDYVVNIVGGGVCTGTPIPGFPSSTATSVCSGMPFAILATGTSPVTGLAFQWYSSPAGAGTFVPITGATQVLYTVASQAVATDYKLRVTCTATSRSDSTSIITVSQNPYYLCGCSPATGVTLNNVATVAPLDSVAIVGTSLNNTTSGTPVYVSYFPTTFSTTAILERGTYYTIAVNSHGTANYNADIWVDFDHSGTFDAGEYTHVISNQPAGSPSTATFYVPTIADTGLTALRVRTSEYSYYMGVSDACSNEFYGATQDYVVRVNPGSPCIGSPLAGASFSTAGAVCPGEAFTLTNTGAANSLGISYQWASRPVGGASFTPISGANSVSYIVSSQSVSTEYTLLVTCSFSGASNAAAPVTVAQQPVYLCVCSPLTGYTLNTDATMAPIDSFFIYPSTLANGTPGSTSLYTQYYPTTTTTTGTLQRGNAYIMGINSVGTSAYKAGVWIDYDHSGVFDNSEYITLTTGAASGAVSYLSFVLPPTADTGSTGMRVRTYAAYQTPGPSDACNEFTDGATQDYVVNITPSLNCFGTPSAGNAISFTTEVCAGEPFTVMSFGYSRSDRISYQWLQSPVGAGTYTPIAGATNVIYTVPGQSSQTDYVMVATCATSGRSDTGLFVSMPMKPDYACYCSPTTGVTLSTSATAAPIDSVAVAGTMINDYTPGSTATYTQYYPSTTTTTDSFVQGNTYTIYVNSAGTANYNASLWIDYNHNGTFDASEHTSVSVSRTAGSPSSISFMIPYLADTGLTGFRVRTTPVPYTLSATDACTNMVYGATHDYIVRIAPGAPCTGTPGISTAYSSLSAICSGTSFNLFDTGYDAGIGISYQWYSRPASGGSFTAITGATSSFLTVSSQTVTTEYRYTTTCSASGLSSNSNTVTVTQIPFYMCYCGAPLGTSYASTQITKVKIPGSALNVNGAFATPYKVFGMVGDSTGTLQKTLAYPIDLKVTGGAAFNAGMWIDYNHNSIFETTEYTRLDTNVASGTTSTTIFTIPSSADTGITGVRIRATPSSNTFRASDACTNITNSQTFDFRMRIDTLVRCSGSPNAGSITGSSPFACPSMTLNFLNDGYAVGSGITYQWLKRTTGAYATISGATTHTLTITGQTVTTDYILVARCSFSGGTDTSNVLTITENPFDSCYCSPPTGVTLVTTGGHHNILLTNVAGLTSMSVPEQSPDSTGYVAVPPTPSSYTTTMRRYYSYPVTVYVNYTVYTIAAAGLWVDYNHNSVFDSAEYVPLTQSSGRNYWSGNINIPATSSLGLTGMRIITKESGTITPSSACSLIPVGQVQDHIITIVPAPCFSIGALGVTAITDSSARGVWGSVAGSFGYNYVFDTSSGSPSGSGTYTTDTFAYSGCLVSGRTYYLHVRDSCDAGYVSGWVTVPFNTLACAPVTTTTLITAVTNTTATLSWAAVAATTGYQYYVDTTAVPSSTATGAFTTGTGPINLTGLTQGTTYYAHVRSGCHCSNFSVWRTDTFTTICDTITHLHTINITDSSVTIRWDSIPRISTYAYVVDTFATPPTGSGAVATDTTVRVTGLRSATRYYAHVRHNCSGGYSNWITIPFTTTRCDTVTGLTAIPSDTGFVFYWTAVSGSMAYYYVINSVITPPIGTTGTYSATTRDTVGGLLSSHTYYLHVRTDCSGGSSGWVTIPVRTLDCDTVSGLNVTAICDTSATLAWATTIGAGFLYVVNTTAATPATTGTYSPVNTIYLTTLTSGTTYYAHVRHLCSMLDTSAWTTISFATPSCDPVTGLAASGVTNTDATISWTPSPCAAGYYYVLDNSSATPSVTGVYLTSTSVPEFALTSGTLYYAHVRVSCGGGVYSAWTTIPFTTLDCGPTAALTVTTITSDGAQINWAPVATAIGYEYAIDNSATPPASGTGVGSSVNYYIATGLLPFTLYYAHVRELCAGGYASTWVTEPFTTAAVGVETINGTSFALSTFPNPVTEKLTIKVSGASENGAIYISDLTGKILIKEPMHGEKLEIDMAKLASGIYMLRYEDDTHARVIKLNKQ